MKINIRKYIMKLALAGTAIAFLACENDDIGPGGVGGKGESYQVSIKGSHPDGPIDATFLVEPGDKINDDKVSLNSNQGTLSIAINLPISETPSGKAESIGLVVQNLDTTNLWNIEDTYKAFHYSLSSKQRKRAILDYLIKDDNFYYGSLNRFDGGSITLKREGDQLVGSFGGTLQTDGGTGKVAVSGSFRANLLEDDLD